MIAEYRQMESDYCKENVEYYVRNYCHIEDKDADEIVQLFDLWPMQENVLESINENRLNIILKARQLGMTWLTLAYVSWCLLFRRGYLALALSRTEDEAKELVRRLGFILRYMPEFVREDVKDNADWEGVKYRITALSIELVHPTGHISTFKAFPSSSGAGRSFTADLLVLDEWAFQQYAREIWLSAYPTINRPTGGKVIGLSTIERGSLFEELFTTENNFNKVFLPWYADPRRDAEWYNQTKADMGDKVMQEYPATVEEALTIPGGSYFPEFSKRVHVIKGQPSDLNYRYVSMDYGLDMFAVLFYEVDTKGNAFVYKQIYEKDLIVSDAAKRLLEVQGEDAIQQYYAPPDLWNRNRDTGLSTAEIFLQSGVFLTRTDNAREQGCMCIKEYLKPTEVKNEQTGELKTSAKLLIYEDAAPDLVRCLSKIQRDKAKPNEYANQPHELTHIVDSLRAFCVGRPVATKVIQPRKKISFDFQKPKSDPLGFGEPVRVI